MEFNAFLQGGKRDFSVSSFPRPASIFLEDHRECVTHWDAERGHIVYDLTGGMANPAASLNLADELSPGAFSVYQTAGFVTPDTEVDVVPDLPSDDPDPASSSLTTSEGRKSHHKHRHRCHGKHREDKLWKRKRKKKTKSDVTGADLTSGHLELVTRGEKRVRVENGSLIGREYASGV